MREATPDFLAIGHVALDKVGDGYTLGGTAVYSALTAHGLGRSAAILTSGAPSEAEALCDRGILLRSVPAPDTTVFENIYGGGGRTQFIRSVAGVIRATDVPDVWAGARTIHLGPIAQEVDPRLACAFDGALIGVTPQGWMRAWDGTGRVWPRRWDQAEQVLSRADVLVFSEQDVQGDQTLLRRYVDLARIAVVTRGDQGCDLYLDGATRRLPAYPTNEVDPTGAGDVFAAAFLLYLSDHDNALEAANFANCVASFSVEAPGTAGIPTREQVAARYRPL